MLTVISPAKTLDYEEPAIIEACSQPDFISDSSVLIKRCRQLSCNDIMNLMKVSEKIAQLNVERFKNWEKTPTSNNAKQAIFAFKGDVYTGFQANTMTENQISYTQKNLRILSGLYGLLKPLDLMQAYRLEMGTKLDNVGGDNLYAFWGDKIVNKINENLKETNSQYLINLASNEYFKAVNRKKLICPIITPVFKDQKNGVYKVISFHAKKARGMMARFIIENEIKTLDELKLFNVNGYFFSDIDSKKNELVFKREEIKK